MGACCVSIVWVFEGAVFRSRRRRELVFVCCAALHRLPPAFFRQCSVPTPLAPSQRPPSNLTATNSPRSPVELAAHEVKGERRELLDAHQRDAVGRGAEALALGVQLVEDLGLV